MENVDENRINSFDFLRALAISYIVIIRHMDDYASNGFGGIVNTILTYIFLGIFVYLSGYLLTSRYSVLNNRTDIIRFFRKRFIRIYPLYFLTLFLFLFFHLMKPETFLASLIFLNLFLGKSGLTIWFVSMICLYYCMFPLFVYRYSNIKAIAIATLVFLCLSIMINLYDTVDKRLLLFLPLFLFGIISYRNNLLDKMLKKTFMIGSLLVCFFSSLLYVNFQGIVLTILFQILFMVSAIPLFLFLGNKASTLVKKDIYMKISYASFCIYLFHRVIFFILIRIYTPPHNIYIILYLALIGLPLIYLVSVTVQSYYDSILDKFISINRQKYSHKLES